jgi:hypothetical protein
MKTRPRPFTCLRPVFSGLELFSPRGLVARAVLLAAIYAVCEAAGLRENTTFLSGTQATSTWNDTVWRGLVYLFAYFGFVLAAPILFIAAALLAAWERFSLPPKAPTCLSPCLSPPRPSPEDDRPAGMCSPTPHVVE